MQLGGRFHAGRFAEGRFSGGRFSAVGAVGDPPEAATVNSVTPGTWTGSAQPIVVATTGAEIGDTLRWVLTLPADAPADDAAGKAQIVAGQNGSGAPAVASGSDTITALPHSFEAILPGGIARDDHVLTLLVDNGALSNVVTSSSFDVDTVAPVLSGLGGSATGGDIDVTVTSDEATGEIFFALRLATDPVLSVSNIINGTGDAIDTDSDDTPAADGTNAGAFLGLAPGTYRADAVQRDDYNNVGSVVSSADITVAASGALFSTDFTDYTIDSDLAAHADWDRVAGTVLIESQDDGGTRVARQDSGVSGNDQLALVAAVYPDNRKVTITLHSQRVGSPGGAVDFYAAREDDSNYTRVAIDSAGNLIFRHFVAGVQEAGWTELAGITPGQDLGILMEDGTITVQVDGVDVDNPGNPATGQDTTGLGAPGFKLFTTSSLTTRPSLSSFAVDTP